MHLIECLDTCEGLTDLIAFLSEEEAAPAYGPCLALGNRGFAQKDEMSDLTGP
jgi:hypothetical protein